MCSGWVGAALKGMTLEVVSVIPECKEAVCEGIPGKHKSDLSRSYSLPIKRPA
jgi:hypothetical protein